MKWNTKTQLELYDVARRLLKKHSGSLDAARDELADLEQIDRFRASTLVEDVQRLDPLVASALVRALAGDFDDLSQSELARKLMREDGLSPHDASHIAGHVFQAVATRRPEGEATN